MSVFLVALDSVQSSEPLINPLQDLRPGIRPISEKPPTSPNY